MTGVGASLRLIVLIQVVGTCSGFIVLTIGTLMCMTLLSNPARSSLVQKTKPEDLSLGDPVLSELLSEFDPVEVAEGAYPVTEDIEASVIFVYKIIGSYTHLYPFAH